MAYHENLAFSMFKCYNHIPGASTNPENMKKDNPVTLFWYAFLSKHVKNELFRFSSCHEIEMASYYNIITPFFASDNDLDMK